MRRVKPGPNMSHQRWIPLACAMLAIGASLTAQAPRTFDAASIRRAPAGENGGWVRFLPGRLVVENVPLHFMLQQIYGLRDFQIAYAPEFRERVAVARYHIQAKADADASPDEVRQMAKGLLIDRFKLRLLSEQREFPVYALVPDRRGVKGVQTGDGPLGGIEMVATGWIRGTRVAPASLAETLSRLVDRPVVDRSGVNGVLDFSLTFTPVNGSPPADATMECPGDVQMMAERRKIDRRSLECPSIFTAVQEQLGLRLDSQRAPLEVLVVDGVSEPTEN